MRNFVFKYELEYLFLKNDISPKEKIDILSILLKDKANMAITDKGMVYYLNVLERDWIDTIKLKTTNENIVTNLAELLGPADDLGIPLALKTKILAGEKVAVFVGAGVSKLLDYPLWNDLGDHAIRFLRDENQIDDFQCSRILNDVKDPKQKLSILENFLKKGSAKSIQFYEKYFLEDKRSSVSVNPYDILVSPVFNWMKITSNIDLSFGNSLLGILNQRRIEQEQDPDKLPLPLKVEDLLVHDETQFKNIRGDKIYHLHGTIKDPSNITFSTTDYIKKYYHKSSHTNLFLQDLFANYSVVFIGYGLEELQILESVITNGIDRKQRHFALFGAYLNEMNYFSIRKKYFDSLNIELQHYYLDFEQYRRLITVLQHWQKELSDERGSDFHKTVDFIEQVLKNAK